MAENNPEALITLLYILKEKQGDGLPVGKISDRFNEISPSQPLMGHKLRKVLRFAADSGLLRSRQGTYKIIPIHFKFQNKFHLTQLIIYLINDYLNDPELRPPCFFFRIT